MACGAVVPCDEGGTEQLCRRRRDPASLQAALLQDLNELLADTSIHERQRFEGVTLHSETQKLLSQNPQGEAPVRLNRLLIEDAYPLELSRIPLTALRTCAQMPMTLPIGTRGDRTVTNLAQLEAPVNGKPDRDWCWEGFFFVRMTDGITNAAPVVVNLEVREDEGEWEREVDLVLGDCWLFAGGPNVGTLLRNPNSGTNVALLATGSTVTNEAPVSCAAFSPKARDKLKLKGGPQSPFPALGGNFAQELASLCELSPHGSRPVWVYAHSHGRRMIHDWTGSPSVGVLPDRLGTEWNGVLDGVPDARIPGVRGVVWWHGEWEVEYGKLASDSAASADTAYACDVDRFCEASRASRHCAAKVGCQAPGTGDHRSGGV